jgi:hypothetical protein
MGIAEVVRPPLTPLFGAPLKVAEPSFHGTPESHSFGATPFPNALEGRSSALPESRFEPQAASGIIPSGLRPLQHSLDNESEGNRSGRMPARVKGERESPLPTSARAEAIQITSPNSVTTSFPETESSPHSLHVAAPHERQMLGSKGRGDFGEDGLRAAQTAHVQVSQQASDPPRRDGMNGSLDNASERGHAMPVHPAATPFDKSQSVAATRFAASLAPVLRNSPHMPSKGKAPEPNQTVEVTIGRLEVRIAAPEGKPARASRTAQPKVNLDDYLRRRSGAGGK